MINDQQSVLFKSNILGKSWEWQVTGTFRDVTPKGLFGMPYFEAYWKEYEHDRLSSLLALSHWQSQHRSQFFQLHKTSSDPPEIHHLQLGMSFATNSSMEVDGITTCLVFGFHGHPNSGPSKSMIEKCILIVLYLLYPLQPFPSRKLQPPSRL